MLNGNMWNTPRKKIILTLQIGSLIFECDSDLTEVVEFYTI